jgi:hypothetical protein
LRYSSLILFSDEAIKQGVRVFGEGNWAKIKANFPELENRSGVQIKDRFRNMMKKEKEVSAKIASGNPVTPGSSAKKGSAEKKKVPKLVLMEYVPDVPVASPAEIKSPGKSECPTLDDCAPKMLVADVPQVPPSPQTSKTVVYFEITIKNLSCTLYEIGLVQKTFPALYELCHHAKEGVRKLMNIISTYDSAEEVRKDRHQPSTFVCDLPTKAILTSTRFSHRRFDRRSGQVHTSLKSSRTPTSHLRISRAFARIFRRASKRSLLR